MARPISVDVHLVKLASYPQLPWRIEALSQEERRLAAAIPEDQGRATYRETLVLLRDLLGELQGCLPADVVLSHGQGQAVRHVSGEVHFSMAHADEWCAIALSQGCPVGIDVQRIRPGIGIGSFAGASFPAVARRALRTATPERRPRVFVEWWTLLEAAAKVGA